MKEKNRQVREVEQILSRLVEKDEDLAVKFSEVIRLRMGENACVCAEVADVCICGMAIGTYFLLHEYMAYVSAMATSFISQHIDAFRSRQSAVVAEYVNFVTSEVMYEIKNEKIINSTNMENYHKIVQKAIINLSSDREFIKKVRSLTRARVEEVKPVEEM